MSKSVTGRSHWLRDYLAKCLTGVRCADMPPSRSQPALQRARTEVFKEGVSTGQP